MKRSILIVIFLPALLIAQAADESTPSLIKKLGSKSFPERQAATKILQDRPEAAAALRDALRSPDRELAKRAGEILDYYDHRPVRALRMAIKEGHIERAIDLIAAWPNGKYEEGAWHAVRDLAKNLADLHQKQGGEKRSLFWNDWWDTALPVLSGKRITNATKGDLNCRHFVRAGDVDLDRRRLQPGERPQNLLHNGALIVASGNVRIVGCEGVFVIFAGGSIELAEADAITNTILVSGGDVTLKCPLGFSLVIARGKVTSTAGLFENRIISCKTVTYKSKRPNLITENEANPLGYIRWRDAPKLKDAPKGN